MGEAKKIATFMALGGIATALCYELKNFETWKDLEESFKKTWCIKLNPYDAIARACQPLQRKEGYIREYILEFRELKRFFGYMSVSTLIDLFMRIHTARYIMVQQVEAPQDHVGAIPH